MPGLVYRGGLIGGCLWILQTGCHSVLRHYLLWYLERHCCIPRGQPRLVAISLATRLSPNFSHEPISTRTRPTIV
ncbi:hypothetical protein BC830DRAFT_1119319, partial [Chytriomyces sp. MP71]